MTRSRSRDTSPPHPKNGRGGSVTHLATARASWRHACHRAADAHGIRIDIPSTAETERSPRRPPRHEMDCNTAARLPRLSTSEGCLAILNRSISYYALASITWTHPSHKLVLSDSGRTPSQRGYFSTSSFFLQLPSIDGSLVRRGLCGTPFSAFSDEAAGRLHLSSTKIVPRLTPQRGLVPLRVKFP